MTESIKKQLISKQLMYTKVKKKYTNSHGDCDKKKTRKKKQVMLIGSYKIHIQRRLG